MPMRGELRPVPIRPRVRTVEAKAESSAFIAMISDPDLQLVVAFCTAGLLAMLNLMLHFPALGEIVAQGILLP
jgi:hypothetical protein